MRPARGHTGRRGRSGPIRQKMGGRFSGGSAMGHSWRPQECPRHRVDLSRSISPLPLHNATGPWYCCIVKRTRTTETEAGGRNEMLSGHGKRILREQERQHRKEWRKPRLSPLVKRLLSELNEKIKTQRRKAMRQENHRCERCNEEQRWGTRRHRCTTCGRFCCRRCTTDQRGTTECHDCQNRRDEQHNQERRT